MYCLGRRDDGNRWKVGIRDPRDKNKLFATLELEDKAIATSGSYENFVMIDGKRYSHIIDPRTGYPADNGVLSVSIIADDAMTADSMATAVFVMGRERGMEFVRRDAGLEAVIIYEDGGETKMEISEGLKGKVSIL
ncbi:MAG: hypothetical protein AUJ75_02180 [Candidatus Omnitrophica bacterium CG1_02_49_10]|nr:MAG: hypothetical protein AUJ75_02180 [Candidatus Omnitrophica bacterium CG1_02_49_10]